VLSFCSIAAASDTEHGSKRLAWTTGFAELLYPVNQLLYSFQQHCLAP
jgi:hypothetical protein